MPAPFDTKEWIRAVAAHMNLSPSALALAAGLAASTVTRFLNDGTGTVSVRDATLDAIAKFSGVPKNVMPGQRALPGFGEPEGVPYDPRQPERLPEWVEAAIAAHKKGRNGVDAWIMKWFSLDLLGVLPGDVLMIDQNKRPKAGDIVCAQITDKVTGRTETVFRRYDPPFLTTHSVKLGPGRPEQVDEDRVVIMGVEVGMIRPRH